MVVGMNTKSRKNQRRRGRKRNRNKRGLKLALYMLVTFAIVLLAGAAAYIFLFADKEKGWKKPPELLAEYMGYVNQGEYEKMYGLLDAEASGNVGLEAFVERNSAIYEGIEAKNLKITDVVYDEERMAVTYQSSCETVAGTVSFENEAYFIKREEGEDAGYWLVWNDGLIFPGLEAEDKVRVSVTEPERGEIFDRNGFLLAGKGTASSVGIVPGKLEERESAVEEIAQLLEMKPETVEKNLSASWVKDDYFVPLKTVLKVGEIELMSWELSEEVLREKERQDKLLEIPGVMITDTEVREYPLGDAAAHLVGYVQNVTAEDLEKHEGEGYTANSVIGRSGMEGLFEKELKGQTGYRIYIADGDGTEKKELANRVVENGKDITLTIDSQIQAILYGQFKEDESCSVAMNPYTGEVLALVSTPSYNNNNFILGMSQAQWESLNGDERQPLYNRFRQVWCPGSSFKPVTAAVGLETGAVDPEEDFGKEGLSWQKDSSWGSYYVTTLHEYEPVVLENALIYSDNIYFAKAALKIGGDKMKEYLQKLGFDEPLPFEISMAASQYSNSESIETEVQLADSGYGQGQILVNPLHLACIYTAFCNGGNMVQPYLVYQEAAQAEWWIPEAFSEAAAQRVLEGLKKIVNSPEGTGYGAHRNDVVLAGKTGTAEIKDSKGDTEGTELGWFAVMTPERDVKTPILIVSMVEDVKERGGSGYVVGKTSQVMEILYGKGYESGE